MNINSQRQVSKVINVCLDWSFVLHWGFLFDSRRGREFVGAAEAAHGHTVQSCRAHDDRTGSTRQRTQPPSLHSGAFECRHFFHLWMVTLLSHVLSLMTDHLAFELKFLWILLWNFPLCTATIKLLLLSVLVLKFVEKTYKSVCNMRPSDPKAPLGLLCT